MLIFSKEYFAMRFHQPTLSSIIVSIFFIAFVFESAVMAQSDTVGKMDIAKVFDFSLEELMYFKFLGS